MTGQTRVVGTELKGELAARFTAEQKEGDYTASELLRLIIREHYNGGSKK